MNARIPTFCLTSFGLASSLSAANPAVQSAASVQLHIALGGFAIFLLVATILRFRRRARIASALRQCEHYSLHGVEPEPSATVRAAVNAAAARDSVAPSYAPDAPVPFPPPAARADEPARNRRAPAYASVAHG